MVVALKKPSQFLPQIKVDNGADWTLLKFNRTLQIRLESLVEKRDQDALTTEESAELDAIHELAAIFAYINSQMAYQRRNRLR
jgi:hypothetical protein